jgi:hypothetical protein
MAARANVFCCMLRLDFPQMIVATRQYIAGIRDERNGAMGIEREEIRGSQSKRGILMPQAGRFGFGAVFRDRFAGAPGRLVWGP